MRRSMLFPLVFLLVAACSSHSPTSEVEQGPLVLVAMGNSATYLPRGDGMIHRYPGRLAEDFSADVDLRNSTVGAASSGARLERIQNDEPPGRIWLMRT